MAVGTAPGMWMKKGEYCFVSLPGVPRNEISCRKSDHSKSSGRIRAAIHHSKTILTQGQGESLVGRLKTGKTVFLILKLAYLPAIGQSAFEAVSKRKRQSFLEKN
jgi:nicotinamide-nucleotide amidase